MPEILGLLLLSLIGNAVMCYLWWQAMEVAKERETLNHSYAREIRRRNQIIMRLCHEAHAPGPQRDELLIQEAESLCENGQSKPTNYRDRTSS